MVHFVDFITSNSRDCRFSYHFKTSFCVRNHCLVLKRCTWSTLLLYRITLTIKCCFKQFIFERYFHSGLQEPWKCPGKNGKTSLENPEFLNFWRCTNPACHFSEHPGLTSDGSFVTPRNAQSRVKLKKCWFAGNQNYSILHILDERIISS